MFFQIVASLTPCSGAFNCILGDIQEIFFSPATFIGLLVWMILLVLVWLSTSKREMQSRWKAETLTIASTILGAGIGIALYSPIKQYDNLKGQFDDAIRSEEHRRFELEAETLRRVVLESSIRELEGKLKAIQDSVQKVQDKSDEIFRNLPKPKSK